MSFESLFQQIEQHLQQVSISELKKAAVAVSERYRRLETNTQFRLHHEIERLAYIAMRMPATTAVIAKVLKEIPSSDPMSLLDVGSGPGSALWASMDLAISQATCIEYEKGWVDIAKKLWQGLGARAPFPVNWLVSDVAKAKLPSADLVIASYCLNELPPHLLESTVASLFQATGRYFVWIEPGSSESFGKMLKCREWLINQKETSILAPCRASQSCPYFTSKVPANAPGWCHFSLRLERPSFHRLIKDVKLSYEDEKFCYLIVEKKKASPVSPFTFSSDPMPSMRLIDQPQIKGAHVRLWGCNNQNEIVERVVSKKHDNYRAVRKSLWGDVLDIEGE